jgi:hypothetical protein
MGARSNDLQAGFGGGIRLLYNRCCPHPDQEERTTMSTLSALVKRHPLATFFILMGGCSGLS